MMPLYLEPAVGLSSTVPLRLLIEATVELNFSSNSSRVASLVTGFWAGGVFLMTLTWPPQPAKISARIANETRSKLRRVVEVGWNFSGTRLVGPCDVHVKRPKRRAHPANHFAGPQFFA